MPFALYRRLTTKRTIYAIAVVTTIGATSYASYNVGLKRGVQDSYLSSVFHSGNYLTSLRAIREEDLPGAIHMLETGISASVVFLSPDEGVLADGNKAAVQNALKDIKSYRNQHPWTGNGPLLTSRVDQLLENVEAPLTKVCP